MNRLFQLSALLLLFFGMSCSSHPENEMNGDLAFSEVAEEVPAAEQPPAPDEMTVSRKLIKEGSLEYETENIETSRKQILKAVKESGGYISSDRDYKNDIRISNRLVIRVPSENFDTLLRQVTKGVEKFDRKEISVKDVTDKFLDIEARLKTKKELEARYRELLQKAQTVKDMIEIEKQIEKLRSDIESFEGRLKFLQNQVALSTLEITLYEPTTVPADFGQKFSTGFRNGWESFILFFVFLTNIWPFVLIGTGLFFGIRIYNKKKKTAAKG